MEPENRIWKSYVWHNDKCYFVSTIERDYDVGGYISRGQETMVWEYDWDTATRGEWIHQAGHICDHQAICRCLINYGEIPDEDDDRYQRFNK